VVLHFVDALLELLDAGAEGAGEIGQALGAEEDEDDDEDHQQLLVAQTKHGSTPFLIPDAPTLRAAPGNVNEQRRTATRPTPRKPRSAWSCQRAPGAGAPGMRSRTPSVVWGEGGRPVAPAPVARGAALMPRAARDAR